MKTDISDNKQEGGRKAAADGADAIRSAIARNGSARILMAASASQFEMLAELVAAPDIDWGKVTAFHLDEYANLPETHPASLRRFLRERFLAKLPKSIGEFHPIQAQNDLLIECSRLGRIVAERPIDVAFIGIGENAHGAVNDPPADFSTDQAYMIGQLDEVCRRQQLGEGWFPTLDEVPTRAISMTVPQIMRSRHIVCTVPDLRKAQAVRDSVEGPVTPDIPASILQEHPSTTLYLDTAAASMLS